MSLSQPGMVVSSLCKPFGREGMGFHAPQQRGSEHGAAGSDMVGQGTDCTMRLSHLDCRAVLATFRRKIDGFGCRSTAPG
jgi:hypothetical protein